MFTTIGGTGVEQGGKGENHLQTFKKQKLTSTGDEAKGVVSGLHVLPEVHVGVVEDVRVQVEVVEALRRQHHTNIITCRRISQR